MQETSPAEIKCRPYLVSQLEVESKITSNGIHADIRRLRWERTERAHFHADSYYLDYALLPRSSTTRLYQPGDRYTPPPGEIVFLPRDSDFDAQCAPCEQRMLCLTFESGRSADLFEGEDSAGHLAPCFDVKLPRVRQGLARLAEELREPGFAHEILIEAVALTLVVELCRHLRERSNCDDHSRGQIADWRLRRLKERIEAGLSGSLSIAHLAEECGMSPRHLIRTFKNTVGMTLSDYIAEMRIRRAKQELALEESLIKVVAGNCGFQSAAAFSAAFRKATGQTPKQFRQEKFRYDA